MGNASSRAPRIILGPPVVREEPYPGGGVGSILDPSKAAPLRASGVSVTTSQTCPSNDCKLAVIPGISSSSANMTRVFGDTRGCGNWNTDLARVRNREMSVQDFVGGVQSGKYMRPGSTGFCEEVQFPDDVLPTLVLPSDLNDTNLGKLKVIRIRKISSGGFSSDTKARFKPSIPFEMTLNGTTFNINTITLYHPCPLRVQDQQADAVISLNDPSDSPYNSGTGKPPPVILIPITSGDSSTPSAMFFSRIASQLTNIAEPDQATGSYTSTDIPTGKQWALTQLFPIKNVSTGGAVPVESGFFKWTGAADFVRTIVSQTPYVIQYGWRPSGTPAPDYIMLENALPVSSSDLASLVNVLPVTEWTNAIHPILTGLNGSGVVYSCGRETPNVPMREPFTTVEDAMCDPFVGNLEKAAKGQLTADRIFEIFFNVMVMFAIGVGAYIALASIARMMDVSYADFAKGAGKVTAVWAKKLGDMKMPSLASGLGGLAGKSGLGGLGGLGALAGKGDLGGLGALAGKSGLGALTDKGGLGGLGALAGKSGLGALMDKPPDMSSAAITPFLSQTSGPMAAFAAPPPAPAPAPAPEPKTRKNPIGSIGLPTPEGQAARTGRMGLRGGRTLKHGRGHAD